MTSVLRAVARRPVVAFMVIGLVPAFAVGVIRPIVDAQILPFNMPLPGVVWGVVGVGLGAFLVSYALSGRAGVVDLARRSVRWRVQLRWYLIALLTVPVAATLISVAIYGPAALAAPPGGWPRALAEVAAVFLLQLVLFQLAEEIGFTGFLQHHWQDRYHPMKLTVYVALLWALWHLPDHFAAEGWGVEQLIAAPVVFAIGSVSLFFARTVFVWLYNRTGSSVLLVAIFHASFDASISQLSYDVVPPARRLTSAAAGSNNTPTGTAAAGDDPLHVPGGRRLRSKPACLRPAPHRARCSRRRRDPRRPGRP